MIYELKLYSKLNKKSNMSSRKHKSKKNLSRTQTNYRYC